MAAPQEVSHEDIRDAILSLVTIFRDNSDKLERHEYRERQLGEQLKKALAGLDKRYKNQDQSIERIESILIRFDERFKNFETLMKQRDERERIQLQKFQDSVEKVQDSMSKIMRDLGTPVKVNTTSYTIQGSDNIESLETALTSKIEALSATVEQLQINLLGQYNPEFKSVGYSDDVKKSIRETERLVQKIESGCRREISHALDTQQLKLAELVEISLKTASNLRALPNRAEIHEISNSTHDTLQEIKEELIAISDQGVLKLSAKLEESISGVNNNQDEIMKTVSEVQSMGENLYTDISKSYEQLLKEIRGLSKVEQVMIQTADNVLDTKRRIEYGVHQILLEVGELIKSQGKTLNGTVNQRFDDIESSILENQMGALTNLSSKIETEISQVWRQIGIMYQQLTASADALDRLQQQTDAYVNGSVKTMDSMEGKVGMITSRMTEVDDNLNYLLGRLSLVTSEFNQIKQGLATALDNIRSSFLEVQNEINKDAGPGPRPISDKDVENQVSPLEVPGK